MTLKKDEDINDQNGKGDDDKSNDQNGDGNGSDQDDGKSKEKGKNLEKLSDEQLNDIVEKTADKISEMLDKKFDSKIDSRIGKLTNTLYKKLGVKDEEGSEDSSKAGEDKIRTDVALRKSSVKVLARSEATDLLSASKSEKDVINRLLDYEIANMDCSVEDFNIEIVAKAVSDKIVEFVTQTKKVYQDQKVDALKKAGQIKDIPEPGTQKKDKTASEELGKEIANKRHAKKTKE